jgi:hypothetical protein
MAPRPVRPITTLKRIGHHCCKAFKDEWVAAGVEVMVSVSVVEVGTLRVP